MRAGAVEHPKHKGPAKKAGPPHNVFVVQKGGEISMRVHFFLRIVSFFGTVTARLRVHKNR